MYDNSFNAMMGEDEDNYAVADHIWSNLVTENEAVEKVTNAAVDNQ